MIIQSVLSVANMLLSARVGGGLALGKKFVELMCAMQNINETIGVVLKVPRALYLKKLWANTDANLHKINIKEEESLMFKNDYLEQQIEALCRTLAALIFGQELTKEILTEEEERGLELSVDGELTELLIAKQIQNGKIEVAQTMILELIKSKPSAENLMIALNAYNKMLENNEEDENLNKEIIKIRDLYLEEKNKG